MPACLMYPLLASHYILRFTFKLSLFIYICPAVRQRIKRINIYGAPSAASLRKRTNFKGDAGYFYSDGVITLPSFGESAWPPMTEQGPWGWSPLAVCRVSDCCFLSTSELQNESEGTEL
ncbi:rCG24707, partial [Rattus norvegicus]